MTPLGRGSRDTRNAGDGRRRGRSGDGRTRCGDRAEAPRRVLCRAGGARPGGGPPGVAGGRAEQVDRRRAGSGSVPRRIVSTRSRASTARRPSRRGPRVRTCVEMDGRLVRYRGTIPRLRPHVLADVGQAMLRIDRMAAKVPARGALGSAEGACSGTARRPGRGCAATWPPAAAATLLEVGVKGVWAAMPADVSFLHFLFYVASAGKLDLLLDTDGGAQQDRFVEGAGALAARVAADTRRPPRAVGAGTPHRVDGRTRRACTRDGVEVRAQRVIVAVPPTLAGRIWYDPPLPGLPRSAHTARADGRGDQVLRRLRRAVLARGGPERQRGQRRTAR